MELKQSVDDSSHPCWMGDLHDKQIAMVIHLDNDNSFQRVKINKYNTCLPTNTQYLRILSFENYQCVFSKMIAIAESWPKLETLFHFIIDHLTFLKNSFSFLYMKYHKQNNKSFAHVIHLGCCIFPEYGPD